jgi:hypothetical protein
MVRITFNLDDPENTRKVEQVGDGAADPEIWCEILLEGFEDWIKGVSA